MDKYEINSMKIFIAKLRGEDISSKSSAYDFISQNYIDFSKEELANIIKELLYAIFSNCRADWNDVLEETILNDVATELEDRYDRYEL